MYNFAIQKSVFYHNIDRIIFDLYRNEKCLIQEFIDDVSKDNNLKKEVGELIAILQFLSNKDIKPPPTKWKKLKNIGKNKHLNLYEIKSKHLRLYYLDQGNSKEIILIGGKKKDQKYDLKRIEKLFVDLDIKKIS